MTKSAVEFLVLLAHLLLLSPSSWWLTWGRGGGQGGWEWWLWVPSVSEETKAHGLRVVSKVGMLLTGSCWEKVPPPNTGSLGEVLLHPWPAGSSRRRGTGSWEWKAWWHWCPSAGSQACTEHTVRALLLFCRTAVSPVYRRARSDCAFSKIFDQILNSSPENFPVYQSMSL